MAASREYTRRFPHFQGFVDIRHFRLLRNRRKPYARNQRHQNETLVLFEIANRLLFFDDFYIPKIFKNTFGLF